jgi:hypothetical protein
LLPHEPQLFGSELVSPQPLSPGTHHPSLHTVPGQLALQL